MGVKVFYGLLIVSIIEGPPHMGASLDSIHEFLIF